MGLEINGETLTEQYKFLRNKMLSGGAKEPREEGGSADVVSEAVDAIYTRIVASPVTDVASAVEKLRFAYHCLTDEEDFKEAANLVLQVCCALEALPAEVVLPVCTMQGRMKLAQHACRSAPAGSPKHPLPLGIVRAAVTDPCDADLGAGNTS